MGSADQKNQRIQPAKNCGQCGRTLPPPSPSAPESTMRWCDDACADAWDAAHPGYWTKVADLTPEQRAELDAILGNARGGIS